MHPIQYNTHTRSPGWAPLKKLFLANAAEFLKLHADQRFTEKHLIGAAMWDWMCRTGLVDAELKRLAEELHYRPTKEKSGLPLWRLAFRSTLRNTPEVDALFVGKRLGPTPRYARLVSEGIAPPVPRDYRQEGRDAADAHVPSPEVRGSYVAREEWMVGLGGDEWLYVYTTKRELDNFESRGIEPLLKIGQTRQHYTTRIANQIGSTSAHSPAVCLLAYQVRNAQHLEAAVHKALKVQDRHVKDAPGIEWFEVSPEAAHQLIVAIGGSVRPLS
jgi:hypothetical protein